MNIYPKILSLIAVGASVPANSQPCLEKNIETALRCGADPRQIAEPRNSPAILRTLDPRMKFLRMTQIIQWENKR